MAVTIKDIANRLHLSVGAVSRALSGYTDIAEDTRQRIFEAAREMGYTPNRAARQLRKQTTGMTIGYIMPVDSPRFADSYFSEFIEGLGDETAAQHSDLLIATAQPGQEAEKTAYREWIENSKVDGLILDRLQVQDWRVQYLAKKRVPFSSLEREGASIAENLASSSPVGQKPLADYPSVEVDSFNGLIELVAHIAGNSFHRLAYIGGPPALKIQVDRFAGFQAGLAQTNLPFDPELVLEGDLTSASGYLATKRLLSIPDPPDAIVCVNDQTAFGALRAVDEAGHITGEDIAVAGFDGVRDARYSNPPLTTLDQPVYDIARQLVRLLSAQISGQPLPMTRVVLQPTLLIRASTGNQS
jgi:LacI family transcriptional regulator